MNSLKGHLRNIIPELDGKEIGEDETLRNLGANSVDRGELINLILEELEFDIPRVELAGAETLSEMADLLTEKLALVMDKDLVLRRIANHLKEMIPELAADEVNETSMLTLLGASSVDRAELIERMREEMAIKADRFDFHIAGNLGELSEMLIFCYKRERLSDVSSKRSTQQGN